MDYTKPEVIDQQYVFDIVDPIERLMEQIPASASAVEC